MTEYFLTADLRDGSRLYISPLSDRQFATIESDFQDNRGHFLYRRRDPRNQDDIEVLAHLAADESIFSLCALLGMA